MARSKKKTAAQHLVGVGAMAFPAPIRDVVASRWGARVTLVLVCALAASGVLTLDWSGGVPHLQVNKERAIEVQHNLEHSVEQRLHMADGESTAKEWLTDRWNTRNEQQ